MATLAQGRQQVFDELTPPLTRAQALVEADRCLECGIAHAQAPCLVACPAAVDVPAFVAAIARDEPDEAARIIFAENLLGGTCARVCPVELLCEGACVLHHEGRKPVAVARLQRYASEHALARGRRLRAGEPYNWLRVVVIGAGPAGLVCAGELAALGYDVSLYDGRLEPGGLARYAIAPYRLQREPLPQEAGVLAALGVHFELGIGIETPEALAGVCRDADAVVLAVGMGADADVHYPGDDLTGVWESLPFIERVKDGPPPELGERVVVIGGGNTAVDVAREAVRLGSGHVTILYRRTRAEMPAYPHEVAEAEEEGVEFEWLALPSRILGAARVEAVECRRAVLGPPDADGRRRPVEVEGSDFRVDADTVVKAIGQQPRAEFLSWIDGVVVEHGTIQVDPETGQTGNPKFFAAGDACNGGATVVEAVRAAKIAALGVHEWLDRGWA